MLTFRAVTFVGILGTALVTQGSLASDIPTLGVNLCTLHYSKIAYGKPVKAVVAHEGMYRDCTKFDGSEPYWAEVRDRDLVISSEQNSFGTKSIIFDRGSTYEPCKTQPIVQYWVTFEDGTTKIEEPVKIKMVNTYFFSHEGENLGLINLIADFDTLEVNDIKTTACIELASYGELAFDLVQAYAPHLHLEDPSEGKGQN